jgi:hypothetical protein
MAEKRIAKHNIEEVVLWKWNVVCNCTYDPDNDYAYTIYNWESTDDQPTKTQMDSACAEYQAVLDSKHYTQERQYPLIGEQLDMLWHDINDGKLDNTGSFYTTLKKVKDDNPKSE